MALIQITAVVIKNCGCGKSWCKSPYAKYGTFITFIQPSTLGEWGHSSDRD